MKSTQESFLVKANSGHLIISFDFKECDQRTTVGEKYGKGLLDYGRFDDHVIAGTITETGEDLVLPPQFATCTLARKTDPQSRPSADYVNNPLITELINGSTPKAH